MKQILFRGISKLEKKWVYGGIVHQTDFYCDEVDKYFIIDGTNTVDYDIGEIQEIINETRGQYTCVPDKNGEKLFEGDITTCGMNDENDNWVEHNAVVRYDSDWGMFVFYMPEIDQDQMLDTAFMVEKLGNIYDNPELLKVDDEK